mmetsp:Transcript_32244/g.47434  ORF Transcript_32244/g.47434 Transcript_32244/m.47434 type:complete len:225 (-) Transcript_32244:93-767(-)|eukprot:CAMPEP_0195520110 /NCGR_PEP_ID=MMETSP0794_2-20130614/16170_1 /TAXON_ID=515487 /ORGANISM="Stephanopyxis turris, Strain CCMP 815" /LENGTH=224 /DNA_ID=CAMNT_0040649395 /DNA_START=74 /DNA_END=748 /DNA_ORIENTATION=-
MSEPAVGASSSPSTNDSASADIDRLKQLQDEASKTSLNLSSITVKSDNPREIPAVIFVEDITAFAKTFTPAASAELLIGAFSDLYGKYKAYEGSLAQKKARYLDKIPEIVKSLSLVRHLKSQQQSSTPVITRYNLADTLYAKAELNVDSGTVNLWLGANVMLEYTYDEAIDLLSSKEETARKEEREVTEDLAFIRNQIITSEVNISRIYNWDVKNKRADKMNKV